MRRFLLPCALALSTAAVAAPVLAEEAPPTPVSASAAEQGGDRAAVEWTVKRMSQAQAAPRSDRSAHKN